MSRFSKILLQIVAVVLMLTVITMFGYYKGWHITAMTPQALSAKLAPDYEIFKPDGNGPFPTVIGLHGCSGMLDGNRDWAEHLKKFGYATILVDSLTFRGYDWPEVCAGDVLWGAERAGDLIASMIDVRKMDFVDQNHLILMGWSHGGWALIDALNLVAEDARPPNLSSVPGNIFSGVRGAIVFYPFCAFPSLGRHGWSQDIPTHFVLAENDSIVPNEACMEIVTKQQSENRPATVYIYKNLDHAFDMRTSDFYEGTLKNDPGATLDVYRHVTDFLSKL